MKKLVILLILIGLPTIASAAVTTAVYRVYTPDSNIPYDDKPIMVGTKLAVVVSSDSDEPWACDLVLTGNYIDYGRVWGRGWNDVTLDYQGSHFPAAGENAIVYDWLETDVNGISCSSGDQVFGDTLTPGVWFIVDYTAKKVGDCKVGFCENFAPASDPSYYITFHQIPTRDLNADTIVNFKDFAKFAKYWQQNCGSGNCQGADLDNNHAVNIYDLSLFYDYWLETTE